MAAIRCGMVAVMIAGMLLIFFALVMLSGSSLAIDAEDKVALGTSLLPLILGTTALAAGVVLLPRTPTPHKAPPSGW